MLIDALTDAFAVCFVLGFGAIALSALGGAVVGRVGLWAVGVGDADTCSLTG